MNEFVTLTSNSEWFKRYPEKQAGVERKTTSRQMPYTIDGTKEDVITMFSFLNTEKPKVDNLELIKIKARAKKKRLELLKLKLKIQSNNDKKH